MGETWLPEDLVVIVIFFILPINLGAPTTQPLTQSLGTNPVIQEEEVQGKSESSIPTQSPNVALTSAGGQYCHGDTWQG